MLQNISTYFRRKLVIPLFTNLNLQLLIVVVLVIAALCCVLFFLRAYSERTVGRYVHRRLQSAYFCGYPLDYAVRQRFWPNLERYLNLRMSDIAAITMMCAMQGNRSAKIVSCKSKSRDGNSWHTWVSFRFLGVEYFIDPLISEDVEVSRYDSSIIQSAVEIRVCSSQKFWSTPVCRQISDKLRRPETSYLFSELYTISGNPTKYADFPPFDEPLGEQLIPIWFNNSHIVAQNIVDTVISNASYQEPSSSDILSAMRAEIRYRNALALRARSGRI